MLIYSRESGYCCFLLFIMALLYIRSEFIYPFFLSIVHFSH